METTFTKKNLMKHFFLLFASLFIFSCGGNDNQKKKGFEYNRVKKEPVLKNTSESSTTPIDLSNRGIGPVKDLKFEENIDLEMVEIGAAAFKQKCTACHKTNNKLIGPAMAGIFDRRHPAWVMNILLNPTEMLQEDPIAKALLKEYNNILMLNQNLSQEEARAITEYLRTL